MEVFDNMKSYDEIINYCSKLTPREATTLIQSLDIYIHPYRDFIERCLLLFSNPSFIWGC